jgi:hypothetical protein
VTDDPINASETIAGQDSSDSGDEKEGADSTRYYKPESKGRFREPSRSVMHNMIPDTSDAVVGDPFATGDQSGYIENKSVCT